MRRACGLGFTALIGALSLIGVGARAGEGAVAADLVGWLASAEKRVEVRQVLAGWRGEEGGLGGDFVSALQGWARARLSAGVAAAMAAERCEDRVEVTFLEPGTLGHTPAERAFEASVFGVETFYCLTGGDPAAAAGVYHSEKFRLKVMPGLESFRDEGGQLCLETGAVLGIVEATDFCLDARRLEQPGLSALHTRLVSNAPRDDTQPLYFREGVVIFRALPDGGVLAWRDVLTRGPDLGAIHRPLLRHTSTSGQERAFQALQEALSAAP